MKKIIILVISLTQIVCTSFAQSFNIPDNSSTAPTATLTQSLTTLPAAFTPSVSSTGVSLHNLTRTFVPMVPLASTTAAQFSYIPGSSQYNERVSTTYVNGWGEKIETIDRGNATIKDIIQPYDERASLTSVGFLPYTRTSGSYFQANAFASQRTYNNSLYPNESNRSYSQSVTSYPGGVPTTKSYSPGRSFVGAGNGTTVTMSFNKATDNILVYTSVSGQPHQDGTTYAANQLIVKTTTTPHNGKVLEFADKGGKLVCKWVYASASATILKTYYVYNDLGDLIHVLTPLASSLGLTPGTDISRLTHCYEYNNYGSTTMTRNPDQDGPTYTVYDVYNRPVLTQTPLLRTQNKFEFTIYDTRDRVVFTGIYTEPTTGNDHTWWQNELYTATSAPSSTNLLQYFLTGPGAVYPSTLPTVDNGEILQVNIYDEYAIPRAYAAITGWTSSLPNAVQPTPFLVANGLVTSSLVKVRDAGTGISSDRWSCSVLFYDLNGRVIQAQTLNAFNARPYATCLAGAGGANWDILNTQYTFSGNKIRDYLQYNDIPSSDKPATRILNVYNLNVNYGERLENVTQAIDGGGMVPIATYSYDELGKVTKKSLGGIEIQNYDYNIRGQLTGINRNYVDDRCGPPGAKATFGAKLYYDFGFTKPRYDGQISGFIWSGASHTVPIRSYGYEYDAAGRMTHAEFRQFCTPGMGPGMGSVTCIPFIWTHTWNKDKADFTTSNVQYDYNGNVLSMKERCALPGGVPADMDNLSYAYKPYTNRLESVTDAVAPDYNLGEFTDVYSDCGTPSSKPGAANAKAEAQMPGMAYNSRSELSSSKSQPGGERMSDMASGRGGGEHETAAVPGAAPCADYDYDADGNLIKDENKHITSITYNEQDLPLEVNFAGGSKITNMYTANGTLVRKVIHDVSATADEVYRYWGPFTYKGDGVGADKLQYVLHAEGRARYTAATNLFTYDYFVKDHLGNVRSIVTGNVTNVASGGGGGTTAVSLLRTYLATHEISLGALEGAIFMNLANVRFNKPIAVTSTDVKAARLNGSHPDRRVGTAIMLKVMAGDRFDLSAKSFWVGNPCAPTTSSSNMASAMLGVLTGAQSSLGMAEGTGAQLVADAISPSNYAAYQSILNTLSNPFAPRAYINYMVFDEKMNLLPLQSGAIQVSALQGSWRNMAMALPLRIQKNGYLAVSVSNASNTDVFIDNIKIDVYQGNLLNEQHYYPFGLAINEGDAAGVPKNKFKYQGKEITEALDLQLYDFGPRQYDPQIGRFWGVDPASQFPSGYTGMGNDPANMIDPTGCVASYGPGGIPTGSTNPRSTSQRAGESTFNFRDYSGGLLEAIEAIAELWRKEHADENPAGGAATVPDNAGTGSTTTTCEFEERKMEYGGDGNNNGWLPLTKAILRNYIANLCPNCSTGQLENLIGAMFENAWHRSYQSVGASDGYTPNYTTQEGGTRPTVPDGIANGILNHWFPRIWTEVVRGAAWFEVKAKNGNIYNSTSSGQILGHITNLAAQFVGSQRAATSLSLITTSDVSVAPSVVRNASLHNIVLYQYTAQYMLTNGAMNVRFQYSNLNGTTLPIPYHTPTVPLR